jgi:hypothetical protein
MTRTASLQQIPRKRRRPRVKPDPEVPPLCAHLELSCPWQSAFGRCLHPAGEVCRVAPGPCVVDEQGEKKDRPGA